MRVPVCVQTCVRVRVSVRGAACAVRWSGHLPFIHPFERACHDVRAHEALERPHSHRSACVLLVEA